MSKSLFIAEKPSVALEFAKTLNIKGNKKDGYIESNEAVITWCIGHMVTMSYPEVYDERLKKWALSDLPFLPDDYKYEVIKSVEKQFNVIKTLMNRSDISTIYVCTDSGREGEYIYRLVDAIINVEGKIKKRVWIDSQTEEEIKKGVKNAKPLSDYDNLANAAYLRAKEDYLMGINFSRLLTLSYGNTLSKRFGKKYVVIAVGRVMTCVLGMLVQREREIQDFIKTPYYKIISTFQLDQSLDYDGEWKAIESSNYYISNLLYKDIGFKEMKSAEKFISYLKEDNSELNATVEDIKKKKETKNPPLLYNLAELQNELSKKLKINPDETLKVAQKLYENKMITYPRTDARVLSTAVAKEIESNLKGLLRIKELCKLDNNDEVINTFVQNILSGSLYIGLDKTKYVNDKAITDHYAIIPTGEGIGSFNRLSNNEKFAFLLIVRRFLAIFYPSAIFSQLSITTKIKTESFFTMSKICIQEGYLEILNADRKEATLSLNKEQTLKKLKKGQAVKIYKLEIKESETAPPKRFSSGSMILAMESAGKLIEDDELREHIKGSGIGTSATRSGILNKLQHIDYISLNEKTQILTPTSLGESIYDIVNASIPSLLMPELTASWEKGLGMIANGEIQSDEYMVKLEAYIRKNTQKVLQLKDSAYNSIHVSTSYDDRLNYNKIREKRVGLGKCIACETGEIFENSKAYYCSNWKQMCEFTVWKDSLKIYAREIDREMIKELLKKGKIDNLSIVDAKTNIKSKATIKFKDIKKGTLLVNNIESIAES